VLETESLVSAVVLFWKKLVVPVVGKLFAPVVPVFWLLEQDDQDGCAFLVA
jgi:hypothetical protein